MNKDKEIIGIEMYINFDENLQFNSDEEVKKALVEELEDIEYVDDFKINKVFLDEDHVYQTKVDVKIKNNKYNSNQLSSKLSQDINLANHVSTKW